MDANRFDTLTRTMGAPASRRAALGATLAGGFLGALGLARNVPEARAAQGAVCTLAFSANVRLGPGLNQPLSAEGQPGALRGNLSFGLDQSGRIINGELQASSGERFPVVGQAMGNSLQARIELAPRVALVVIGVGEQEVSACRGAFDGMMSGPQVGDLGDWHAAEGGGRQGGGQNSGGATGQGGQGGGQNSGGRSDRGGNSGGRGNQGSGVASGGNAGGTQGSSGRGQAPAAQGDVECPPRETFCDLEEGYCADLQTNFLNCGACGNVCRDPQPYCFGGRCLSEEEVDNTGRGCVGGFHLCHEICVSFSDEFNCGGCDIVCEAGTTCLDGQCTTPGGGGCGTGLMDCAGICINPGFDNANCGGCGLACAAGTTCVNGACVPEGSGGGCKTGFTGCGGVCVDFNTDPANCGGCGFGCVDGAICQGGECTPTTTEAPPQLTCADQGLTECFGVCVDVATDPGNCGECGPVCLSGQCVGGRCTEAVALAPEQGVCPSGQSDCGGGCIDVMFDSANCGSCGNVCPTDQTCFEGGCAFA